jgi:hypothetical protein
MLVFHFDLVDGTTIADAGGHLCADVPEAQEVARYLAIQLARSEPQLVGRGLAVAVKSQDGEEIYRAEIDELHRRRLAH